MSQIPRANAFEEELRQLNPRNIEQFIDHLTELTEKAKNARKDAVRFGRNLSRQTTHQSASREHHTHSRDSHSGGRPNDYGTGSSKYEPSSRTYSSDYDITV